MPSPASPIKTVVVAAETPFVRDRFRTALEQAGHLVIAVASAGELIARVRFDDAGIDLLILDLHLSNSAGTELVAAVRRIDDGRMPVLIFSGSVANADEVRELARMRVSGYLNEHCETSHVLRAVAPHLFPDNFNRRSNPRVVLGVPVQYRVGSTIAAALTLNLGHGGVGIRTTSPIAAGTRLRVRVKLPGTERDAEAEGRVAWNHHRLGMGVQFESVDAESQVMIDTAVGDNLLANPDGATS